MIDKKEKEKITRRIYYLSKRKYVSNYMTKKKWLRTFVMKTYSQKEFLPRKTQEAVNELMKYNCQIIYTIK